MPPEVALDAQNLTERYTPKFAGSVAEQVKAWDARHMVNTIELATPP